MILKFGPDKAIAWLEEQAHLAADHAIPLSIFQFAYGTDLLAYESPEPLDQVLLHPYTAEHQKILSSIVEQHLKRGDSSDFRNLFNTPEDRQRPYLEAVETVKQWQAESAAQKLSRRSRQILPDPSRRAA